MGEIVYEAAVYFKKPDKQPSLHSRQLTFDQAESRAKRANEANEQLGLKGEYLPVIEHYVTSSG